MNIGRCFRAVDFISDEEPKLIAIDEETNHDIVHPITPSATLGHSAWQRSPRTPLASSAEVLWPCTEATGVVDEQHLEKLRRNAQRITQQYGRLFDSRRAILGRLNLSDFLFDVLPIFLLFTGK